VWDSSVPTPVEKKVTFVRENFPAFVLTKTQSGFVEFERCCLFREKNYKCFSTQNLQ